jgi:hypothetical protein
VTTHAVEIVNDEELAALRKAHADADEYDWMRRLLATIDALKAQRDAAAELLSDAPPSARGFGQRLTREQMIGLVASIKDRQLHDAVADVTSELLGCRAEAACLRFCLDTMISYLGHQDQDADHAWMVKKMRGALNGEPFDAEIAAFLAEEQAR